MGGRGPLRVKGERSEFILTLDTPPISIIGRRKASGLPLSAGSSVGVGGGGGQGSSAALAPLTCKIRG